VLYGPANAVVLLEGSAAAGVPATLNHALTVTQTKYAYQNEYKEKAHAHVPFRSVSCFTWPLITPKLIQIESTTN